MFEHINGEGILRSVTDFWLPLIGWFAAAAVVWLVWKMFRRGGGR